MPAEQEVVGNLVIGFALLAMFGLYCWTIVWAYRDAPIAESRVG